MYLNIPSNNAIKSNDEKVIVKEMAKLTNISLQFISPAVGHEAEAFSLMVASSDLPDLIFYNIAGSNPAKLIEDNVIVRLNDEFEKGNAPYLSKLYDEYPEHKKQSMLDDGTLFYFPDLSLSIETRAGGPAVRADWLEKLNLQAPVTLDDWYNMLIAFRDDDPNGNGLKDEIPVSGLAIGPGQSVVESIESFACMFGIAQLYFQEDGKIKFGAYDPRYLDFVTTMNQWYNEKLIDQEFASNDDNIFSAKVTNSLVGAWFARINGVFGRYITATRETNPAFDLVGVGWPIGPGGKAFNLRSNMNSLVPPDGMVITGKNKYVSESVRYLDYSYSDEGHMLMAWGIEGDTYTVVNGEPVFTDKVLRNPEGLGMQDVTCQYSYTGGSWGWTDAYAFLQALSWPQQRDALTTWRDNGDISLTIPPLAMTAEENTRFSAIMGDVNTYVNEMFQKYVMGVESLSNFDQYIATLKSMKIEEAIALRQAALDRYNARK
jgi:putative aldouronate transport system substrate-binding protein